MKYPVKCFLAIQMCKAFRCCNIKKMAKSAFMVALVISSIFLLSFVIRIIIYVQQKGVPLVAEWTFSCVSPLSGSGLSRSKSHLANNCDENSSNPDNSIRASMDISFRSLDIWKAWRWILVRPSLIQRNMHGAQSWHEQEVSNAVRVYYHIIHV